MNEFYIIKQKTIYQCGDSRPIVETEQYLNIVANGINGIKTAFEEMNKTRKYKIHMTDSFHAASDPWYGSGDFEMRYNEFTAERITIYS